MLVSLVLLGAVLCGAPLPPPLFTDAAPARGARPPRAGPVLRSREVAVDLRQFGAAPPERLLLNLFPDCTPVAILESATPATPSGIVWAGRIVGAEGGRAIIVVRNDVMAAHISCDGAEYGVTYLGDGVHLAYEPDPCAATRDIEVVPPAPVLPPVMPLVRASALGEMIDVLVVYTQTAREMNGGTAGIEAAINLEIGMTNDAYLNSRVAQRLRLVHTAEVNYPDDWHSSHVLEDLAGGWDGLDVVHAMREEYKADLVSMLVWSLDVGGIAYLMTSELLGPPFADYAYSVVKLGGIDTNYAFAHELGHNMGCEHDRVNAPFHGAYPYSYGYQEPGGAFRTIMAYRNGCPGSCPVIGYFSNPDVYYGGAPTGVNYLASNSADNARTLNNTAPIVANFRGGSGPVPGDYLTVTVSSAAPAAGDPLTVDAAVQPLGTRFDAYGVIMGGGEIYSFDLVNPGGLRPGVKPLATNVPGLDIPWSGRLFTLGAIPPDQRGRAYTVVVGLVPAGTTPSIRSVVPGYIDQERVAVR